MRLSAFVLLASVPLHAGAFAPPALPAVVGSTDASVLRMGPPSEVAGEESYGEVSRKYRRTVYTHAEWVKH